MKLLQSHWHCWLCSSQLTFVCQYFLTSKGCLQKLATHEGKLSWKSLTALTPFTTHVCCNSYATQRISLQRNLPSDTAAPSSPNCAYYRQLTTLRSNERQDKLKATQQVGLSSTRIQTSIFDFDEKHLEHLRCRSDVRLQASFVIRRRQEYFSDFLQ